MYCYTLNSNFTIFKNLKLFSIRVKELFEPIDHFRIILIWPGDRIRRPEHPTENEASRCSCDESV